MNVLEALPRAWTAADQAVENDRQARESEFRETIKASRMNDLTMVAASTILGGAVWAVTLSVKNVALPVIAYIAVIAAVVTGLTVHRVVSYSNNPIQEVLFSIGKGAAIATIVTLLVLTTLKFLP